MIGIVNAGGGGLTIDVVGGTAKPTNPMENTVWVNTAESITGWAFGDTYPDTPQAGMVAFLCRPSIAPTNLEIGFTEKSVKLYPAFCYQYINNEWVSKNGSIYTGGAWHDFSQYLYNRGTWNAQFRSAGFSPYAPSGIDPEIGYLHFYLQATPHIEEKYMNDMIINLTGIQKIIVEYTCRFWAYGGYSNAPTFGIFAADGSTVIVPQTLFNSTSGAQSQITPQEFDVSSVNLDVKLCFFTHNDAYQASNAICDLDIYSIKLVPDDA